MYLHTLLLTQELQQKAEAKVAGLEAQIAMLRDQLSSLQVPRDFPSVPAMCLHMSGNEHIIDARDPMHDHDGACNVHAGVSCKHTHSNSETEDVFKVYIMVSLVMHLVLHSICKAVIDAGTVHRCSCRRADTAGGQPAADES